MTHKTDCAIHGCEGWNGDRFCDCGAVTPAADAGPRQMTAKQFVDNWLKENCYHEWMCANTTFTEDNAAEAAEAYYQYKSAPPVPQEAAPAIQMQGNPQRKGTLHALRHVKTIACHAPPRCKRVEPATAPDEAMRVAQQIVGFYLLGTSPAKPFNSENVAALIREAGSERERRLLLLAGRLCESQSPEWGDVDGATIEEWLLEAGLFKQIDVTEPCEPENCQCAEYGFPTKCNRRTELGKQAVAEASRLLGGEL